MFNINVFKLIFTIVLCYSIVFTVYAGDVIDVLVDPTAPPQANEITPGVRHLQLDAVMMSSALAKEKINYAIINGKTVKEGDRVDGATVLTIENSRVEITRYAKRHWLSLFDVVNIKAVDKGAINIEVLVEAPAINYPPIELVSTHNAALNNEFPHRIDLDDKESQ